MITNFKKIIILSFLLICCGCTATQPKEMTQSNLIEYDRNSLYNLVEHDKGFYVNVLYKKYQFIPESSAVTLAAKSIASTIAYEHSDKISREIKDIPDGRYKISQGRDGLSGVTEVVVQVKCFYKEPKQ
jgi:hypothetical protein